MHPPKTLAGRVKGGKPRACGPRCGREGTARRTRDEERAERVGAWARRLHGSLAEAGGAPWPLTTSPHRFLERFLMPLSSVRHLRSRTPRPLWEPCGHRRLVTTEGVASAPSAPTSSEGPGRHQQQPFPSVGSGARRPLTPPSALDLPVWPIPTFPHPQPFPG